MFIIFCSIEIEITWHEKFQLSGLAKNVIIPGVATYFTDNNTTLRLLWVEEIKRSFRMPVFPCQKKCIDKLRRYVPHPGVFN